MRTGINRRVCSIIATSVLTGIIAPSGVSSASAGPLLTAKKVSPSNKSNKTNKSVKSSASTQRLGVPAASTATAPDGAVRLQTFIDGGVSQVGRTTLYDPAYVALAYPGGDVPMVRGVCTDVIIRAYRAIGFDLQVAVYQDMRRAFSAYASSGRSVPDPNIDHRRVKNLLVFFTRTGAAAPKSLDAADYLPGDVVMWDVSGLAHTGIVVTSAAPGTDRHMIVHNIGDGAQIEDILFAFPITGHFRYLPATSTTA